MGYMIGDPSSGLSEFFGKAVMGYAVSKNPAFLPCIAAKQRGGEFEVGMFVDISLSLSHSLSPSKLAAFVLIFTVINL